MVRLAKIYRPIHTHKAVLKEVNYCEIIHVGPMYRCIDNVTGFMCAKRKT